MTNVQIVECGGLWIAHLPTAYGDMELLCGDGDAPDMAALLLVERFFDGNVDHIASIRRSVFNFPPLWQPIRLAINNEGRLGLQFKHRLTGRQQGMFFADEHSSFNTNLSSITIADEDVERLQRRDISDQDGA